MDVREVNLEDIDLDNQTYRISEDLNPVGLGRSLREVGQLNPVILCPGPTGTPMLVCGFRRLRALQRIGRSTCLARFLPRESTSSLAAFRIALWDNLALRPLEALEKARVLHTLKHVCSVGQDELVEHYLPILGLEAHKNVLRKYLALHVLDPGLRKLLAVGALTLASVERLAGMDCKAQAGAAGLFARASFSASLQRQLLDLLTDLAALRESGVEEVLAQPEVAARLEDAALSPFQKGEAVFKFLYRQRNPRLSAAEERFESDKCQLGLPGSVRLSSDPYFERPRVRVEFEASSPEGFRKASDALQRAAQEPALEGLFRVK